MPKVVRCRGIIHVTSAERLLAAENRTCLPLRRTEKDVGEEVTEDEEKEEGEMDIMWSRSSNVEQAVCGIS